MKKFLSGAFSLFLFIINFFIVGFITYYGFTQTFYIELPMVYLFFHALVSVAISAALLAGVFWSTELTFKWVQKFTKVLYHPYIALHFIGIVYYSFIIGSLESKNEQLPYRILIFYYMVNLGVFWWVYNPVIDVAKEALVARYLAQKKK